MELARREGVHEDSYGIKYASSEGPCLPDELVALIYPLTVDGKTLASVLNLDSDISKRFGNDPSGSWNETRISY